MGAGVVHRLFFDLRAGDGRGGGAKLLGQLECFQDAVPAAGRQALAIRGLHMNRVPGRLEAPCNARGGTHDLLAPCAGADAGQQ